jgi:hypothetical protein
MDILPARRDLGRGAAGRISVLAGGVVDADDHSGEDTAIGLFDLGDGVWAEFWRDVADGGDRGLNRIDAALQSGGGEIDGEFAHHRPTGQSEEYEQEQHRENAEQPIDKEEAVAQAPECILAGGTEEAKREDEADGEDGEEIEDQEEFLAGEVEDDVQGERDQESDSRFAELFIGTSGIRRSGFS